MAFAWRRTSGRQPRDAGARAFAGRGARHSRETACELEIFVHGALCVAYSGQCLSSEAWGGRSANRGQCAQACRLPYEMLVDGRLAPLGDARYLLSPGDLYALRQVPEIVRNRHLRAQDRRPVQRRRLRGADHPRLSPGGGRSLGRPRAAIDPRRELQLEQVYSRGLGPFFLNGTDHQAVVRGRAPRHRGVCMGRVARVRRGGVWIEPGRCPPPGAAQAGRWRGVRRRRLAQPARNPKRAAASSRSRSAEGKLELRFGNGVIDCAPHPPRRPGLAHPRSQRGKGRAPLHRTGRAGAQTPGDGAGDRPPRLSPRDGMAAGRQKLCVCNPKRRSRPRATG